MLYSCTSTHLIDHKQDCCTAIMNTVDNDDDSNFKLPSGVTTRIRRRKHHQQEQQFNEEEWNTNDINTDTLLLVNQFNHNNTIEPNSDLSAETTKTRHCQGKENKNDTNKANQPTRNLSSNSTMQRNNDNTYNAQSKRQNRKNSNDTELECCRIEAIQHFRKACGNEKSMQFVQDNFDLLETMITSSLLLPLPVSTGAIVLEEHSKDIVKACRMIVKEISSVSSSSNSNSSFTKSPSATRIVDSLCLVVHGLRSTLANLRHCIASRDTIILLLYHCIKIAETTCHRILETTKAETSTKNKKEQNTTSKKHLEPQHDQTMIRCILYCIASFEAFGYVLQEYNTKIQQDDDKENGCKCISTVTTTSNQPSLNDDSIFLSCPLPSNKLTATKSTTRKTAPSSGCYSFQQISAMILPSIISVCKVISYLWETCKSTVCFVEEYQSEFVSCVPFISKIQQHSNRQCLDQTICRILSKIGIQIAIPWLRSLDDKDVMLSYTNKMFRIMWDIAKQFTNPMSSILLQKEALLLFLIYSKNQTSDVATGTSKQNNNNNEQMMTLLVRKNHFENACTWSWKAAESFVYQTETKKSTQQSNERITLQEFHRDIGFVLDSFVRLPYFKKSSKVPNSYMEYCAYRVLHIHDAPATATTKCYPTASSCSCIFSKLPFLYSHHCKINKENQSSSSPSLSTSELTLAVVFQIVAIQRNIFPYESSSLTSDQDNDDEDNNNNKKESMVDMQYTMINQIIPNFRIKMSQLDMDSIMWCNKLVSVTKIHNILFMLHQHHQSAAEATTKDENDQKCRIWLSKIFFFCVNPLYQRIVKNEIDASVSTTTVLDSSSSKSKTNKQLLVGMVPNWIQSFQIALVQYCDYFRLDWNLPQTTTTITTTTATTTTKSAEFSRLSKSTTTATMMVWDDFGIHEFVETITSLLANDSNTGTVDDQRTLSLVEKVAKCLNRIGKDHYDRGELQSSLPFLLYSTKLFLALLSPTTRTRKKDASSCSTFKSTIIGHHEGREGEKTAKNHPPNQMFQLSNRFMFVSHVYKTLEMFHEAQIAITVALHFHSIEISSAKASVPATKFIDDEADTSTCIFHQILLHEMIQTTQPIFGTTTTTGHNNCNYDDDDFHDQYRYQKMQRSLIQEFVTLLFVCHSKNNSSTIRDVNQHVQTNKHTSVQTATTYFIQRSCFLNNHTNETNRATLRWQSILFMMDSTSASCSQSISFNKSQTALRIQQILITLQIMAKIGKMLQVHENEDEEETNCTTEALLCSYQQIFAMVLNEIQTFACCSDGTTETNGVLLQQLLTIILYGTSSFFLVSQQQPFVSGCSIHQGTNMESLPKHIELLFHNAMQYADQAVLINSNSNTSSAKADDTNNEIRTLITVAQISIDLFRLQLYDTLVYGTKPSVSSDGDAFQLYHLVNVTQLQELVNTVVQQMKRRKQRSSSSTLSYYCDKLIKTMLQTQLVRLFQLFTNDGDCTSTVRVAQMLLQLCDNKQYATDDDGDEEENDSFKWLRSVYLSTLSTETIMPLRAEAKPLLVSSKGEQDVDAIAFQIRYWFQNNEDSSDKKDELELQMKTTFGSFLQHYHSKLVSEQTNANEQQPPEQRNNKNNTFIWLCTRWTFTTVLYTLAEFYKNSNQILSSSSSNHRCCLLPLHYRSLDLYKFCFTECKDIHLLIVQATREYHRHQQQEQKYNNSSRNNKANSMAFKTWQIHHLALIRTLCTKRQLECLECIALLYSSHRLGIWRQAWMYGKTLIKIALSNQSQQQQSLNMLLEEKIMNSSKNCCKFQSILDMTRTILCLTFHQAKYQRFLLRLLAFATPLANLINVFESNNNNATALLTDQDQQQQLTIDDDNSTTSSVKLLSCIQLPKWKERFMSFDQVQRMEQIKDVEAVFDLLYLWDLMSTLNVSQQRNILKHKMKMYIEACSLPPSFASNNSINDESNVTSPQLWCQYNVTKAILNLSYNPNDTTAIDMLERILQHPYCSNPCRVLVYYVKGTLGLQRIRKTQYLNLLWQRERCEEYLLSPFHSDIDDIVTNTKQYLEYALYYVGLSSSSSVFVRNCQRSLALLLGPNQVNVATTWMLVNESIATRGSDTNRSSSQTQSSQEKQKLCVETILEYLQQNNSTTNRKVPTTDKDKKENDTSLSLSTTLLDDFLQRVPNGWRFVSAALCPTGELLITSVEHCFASNNLKNSYNAICIFPTNSADDDPESCRSMYQEIVHPLDVIITKSQQQLSTTESSESIDTQAWWSERRQLNVALEHVLDDVETKLFHSTNHARNVICGEEDRDGGGSSYSGKNLTSIFDSLLDTEDSTISRKKQEKTKTKNTTMLSAKEYSRSATFERPTVKSSSTTNDKVKMLDVHTTVLKRETNRLEAGATNTSGIVYDDERTLHHSNKVTFLILDEHLQRFPFENLSCFDKKSICRLPSIHFAIARIAAYTNNNQQAETLSSFQWNQKNTSFVLDPESNLGPTKERILPWLQTLQTKYHCNWNGVVGCPPSFEFMEQALSQPNGLLLFFGHGSGQQYFPHHRQYNSINNSNNNNNSFSSQSEETTSNSNSSHSCENNKTSIPSAFGNSTVQASVVLMGCSSGKLVSVNQPDSNTASSNINQHHQPFPIHYQPDGQAMTYLFSGAPCVIGNLWDVTDRDIDRFAMSMLSDFVQPDSNKDSDQNNNDDDDEDVEETTTTIQQQRSLAQRVADSRSACKMRYIVGAAPVCYGFPIFPR